MAKVTKMVTTTQKAGSTMIDANIAEYEELEDILLNLERVQERLADAGWEHASETLDGVIEDIDDYLEYIG